MRKSYLIGMTLLAAGVSVYCNRTAPAANAASAAAEEKGNSNKAEEKPLSGMGTGVVMSATLKSGSFSNGQVRGPAYNVKIIVKNYTASELQLGEMLIVLEKEQGSDNFAASYVARAPASAAVAADKGTAKDPFASAFQGLELKGISMRRRYQLDWGQDIEKDGTSITVFRAGGSISLSFASPGFYQGLGWGRVSPRAERSIDVEVPFPYKVKGNKEYLAVVLPSQRGRASTAGPAVVNIVRFAPGESDSEAELKLRDTTAVPMRVAELQAMATNRTLEVWRRVFAMNWMLEASPKTTVPLMTGMLTAADTPPLLKMSAGFGLATLKSKEGVEPLLAVLASAPDNKVRWWSIESLGEIGDNAAAPAIRPFLTDADDDVARNAIEAAGKLKDAEAVGTLLAIVKDKKQASRHDTAGTALAAIGNPAAVQGLLGILNDKSSNAREMAADRLGKAGAAEAVPALAAISADRQASENLRKNALGSLGKLGGAAALAALQSGAQSDKKPVRSAALRAMADMKDPAAVTSLIEYAGKAGYASREDAVSELGRAKKTEALPALRNIVSDKQAPGKVRQKACDALRQMEDKQGVASLQTALDDADKDLYHEALTALRSISPKDADAADIAALKSAHADVRRLAAEHIKEAKLSSAAGPLWAAYQAEKEEWTGSSIAEALVSAKFSDQSAVAFLLARMDPKTNKLWYSDVEVLRQLSGQTFGPRNKYVDDKERDAELAKWRQWGESRK